MCYIRILFKDETSQKLKRGAVGRREVEEEEEEKIINEDTFAEGSSAVDRLSLDPELKKCGPNCRPSLDRLREGDNRVAHRAC